MNTFDAKAAAALAYLTGELEYVEQEVLRQPYPELKYSAIIPIDESAPEYADSISFKTLDFSGKPKLVGAKAGDIPLVEVASSKGSVTVHSYGLGTDYSVIELGKAQEMNKNSRSAAINFLAEKAKAAAQLTEQFLDEAFFIGDAETADVKTGLFNDPDVPTDVTGTFLPAAADKTIQEIINGSDSEVVTQELLSLFNKALEQVRVTQMRTITRATHILLPPLQLGLLQSYRIPNTADTMISYLEKVLRIKFDEQISLEGLGIGGTDRMMIYTRDARYVKGHMPKRYSLMAPATKDNVTFVTAGLVRIAGTEIRIPKQHLYVDGV